MSTASKRSNTAEEEDGLRGEDATAVKKQKLDEVDTRTAAASPSSAVGNGTNEPARIRGKRHKYAVLLSYSGRAYFGMQIQKEEHLPTIESQLFDALLDLRLISPKERSKPGDFWYQRAARTDKGVSAVRQVCSLILPLREDNVGGGEKTAEEEAGTTPPREIMTSMMAVEALNAKLPEDILVIGLKRATKTFDAKNACEARSYSYTLPSYAFSQKDEDPSSFRISEERLAEVNEILSTYVGTHNYYNFTCKRSPSDTSCNRYIMSCQCGPPFVRDNIEFVTVHLTGQSFMLHQIRKMIGLCIAIVRRYTDKKSIERAWVPSRFDVPIAPSLGLVLQEAHYHYYNKKYQKTHQPLDWSGYEEKIDSFRKRYIDSVIVDTEKQECTVLKWLETLENHHFDSNSNSSDQAESAAAGQNPADDEGGGYSSD